MPIDSSIALGVQTPNPLQTISSLIGVKTQLQQQQIQQQAMQANAMQNQQSQIALQERQGAQGVLKNINNYRDSQGNIDMGKLSSDVYSVAPTTGSQIMSGIANAQNDATTAKASINSLDANARNSVGSILYSLKGQDPMVAHNTMEGLKASYPNLGPAVDFMGKYILGPNVKSQSAFDSALDQAGRFVQPAPTQQTMQTTEGIAVNDGANGKVVSTKPGTSVPMGETIPGTAFTSQLPPTAQITNPDGSSSSIGPHSSVNATQGQAEPFDASGLQGPGRNAALTSIANDKNQSPSVRLQAGQALMGRPGQAQGGGQQFPNAVPTGLAAGQAQNMQDNVEQMNQHFGSLQNASTGAQLVAGLTGNIKALAQKAITGTESDKLSYANGLLAQFGLGKATDLKTATDLLSKNTSQLSLGSPARSDAAQALIEAARPNSHMTPQAISDAADQIASQVRTNMVVRNFLTPYKFANGGAGDAAGYQAARQQIEQTADPRIFQLEGKSPADQMKFMQSLSPEDRSALVQKAKTLHDMGVIQ